MRIHLLLLLAVVILAHSARAQTFTNVYLHNPALQSGTANQPGAIYKYANAAGANGNLIDAYIKVVRMSNVNTSTTSTDTDAVGLFAFDNAASVNNPGGFDSSFQPVVSSSNVNASGLWTAGACGAGTVEMSYRPNQNYLVHFRIYFKKAGTNTDTALNVKAAFIDIDGFGSGTEAEQNAFMPGASYATDGATTLTLTARPDGLLNAEGQPANVNGILFTTTSAIVQVTYLNRTFVDFGIGMNTHAASLSGSCYTAVSGGRLASVSFGIQPTGITTIASTSVSLSGTVWNDADGSANATFTNIRTNAEPGANDSTLYVYAIDSATGTVVGKASVASNGTWMINDLPKDFAVMLLLSKVNTALGVTNGGPGSALNSGWVATSPLIRPAFRPSANTTGLDFGMEQLPTAGSGSATVHNPGGTLQFNVPGSAFTSATASTDPSPGTVTGILITAMPTGATTVVINGITYGTGFTAFPAAGILVPANPSGQPIQTITADPALSTATTVDISFKAADAAGKTSANTGHAVITLINPIISGKVYDDADGTTDNLIDGTLISSTGSQALYVNLVNSSGSVVGSVNVVNGSFTLTQANGVVANTAYSLVLSTVQGFNGTSIGATSDIPAGWVYTAEGSGAGDATPNGLVALTTGTAITSANFGIEQLPTVYSDTAARQLNPGGTKQIPVPSSLFSGSDPEDGVYPNDLDGSTVTLMPGVNGNLYYDKTLVAAPVTITQFTSSKVTIDPTGSDPTGWIPVMSTFSYRVYDEANKPSAPKTVYVPFDLLTLKLRVYLEGALINNGNAVASDGRPLMRDGLRSSPFTGENSLPSDDPYTTSTLFVNVTGKSKKLAPQTTYAQFQHVTDSATVFSVTGQNAIVDWVYIELRNKRNKTDVVAVRSALVQRDGDIVDVDGVSGLKFPDVAIDSYYVSVEHRTHLGTMAKYAQSATNLQSLVDFTVTTTPLYDNGIVGGYNYTGLSQKANVKGAYRAMWQGDFNGDGKIKYDGVGDDLSILPYDVKHYPKNTKQTSNHDFSYGYRQGDYDMNGKVKSDNPNDDNALLLFQARRYPLNVNNTTNFDYILQQLP